LLQKDFRIFRAVKLILAMFFYQEINAVYGLPSPYRCRILRHVYRFIDINGYL